MRLISFVLMMVLAALQYKLWLGDGNLTEAHHLRQKKEALIEHNKELRQRNEALAAEVLDLKQGLEAVEERARSEMGMIKEGEIFYQIIESQGAKPPGEKSPGR